MPCNRACTFAQRDPFSFAPAASHIAAPLATVACTGRLASRRQMAERMGFEPTIQLLTVYPLSRRAPSTALGHLSRPLEYRPCGARARKYRRISCGRRRAGPRQAERRIAGQASRRCHAGSRAMPRGSRPADAPVEFDRRRPRADGANRPNGGAMSRFTAGGGAHDGMQAAKFGHFQLSSMRHM